MKRILLVVLLTWLALATGLPSSIAAASALGVDVPEIEEVFDITSMNFWDAFFARLSDLLFAQSRSENPATIWNAIRSAGQ